MNKNSMYHPVVLNIKYGHDLTELFLEKAQQYNDLHPGKTFLKCLEHTTKRYQKIQAKLRSKQKERQLHLMKKVISKWWLNIHRKKFNAALSYIVCEPGKGYEYFKGLRFFEDSFCLLES